MTMTINDMITKFNIVLVFQDGRECLRASGIKTSAQKNMIAQQVEAIKAELRARKAAAEEMAELERQKKAKYIADIKAGVEMIHVHFHDGEYLQGWEACGEAAELLAEIGLAKSVSGWGYLVPDEAVKALGETFTYQQAVEYMAPAAEAKKAATDNEEAERATKIESAKAEAKATGKPVEISRYTTDCDGSVDECNVDCIITYIMPDGSTKAKRIHTF